MSQELYINPEVYNVPVLHILNPFRPKIKKKEAFELINECNDSKLVNTIQYLYKSQGDIYPYDLHRITSSMQKVISNFYDSKIKGESTTLNTEQIAIIENSLERIVALLKNYED